MNEASIFEALGVTQPGEGAQEQAAAEPAALEQNDGRHNPREDAGRAAQDQSTPAGEGGKAQEPAAPAPDGDNGTPAAETEAGQSGQDSPEDTGTQPDGLSEDERRENAARRRREEQQRAVNEALAQERERSKGEWTAFFQKAGLKNTLTGKPITTVEEFNEWHAAFQAAKLERDLKAGKLTPEGLKQAISEAMTPTPDKQPGATPGQLPGRDTAQQPAAADMAAAQARIDAEIQEIHKLDPTISTTADLLKMPNAKEFYEFVRKGNTFLDAYRLANREKLEARIAEAAKQQAMNAARSKEHLNATGNSRGAGASGVPADEMELFRLLNPEASEAEIQAYYNKSRKEK